MKPEEQKRLKDLENAVRELQQKNRIYPGGFAPKAVRQPDIDGIIIIRGLAADRPTDGSTEIQAYYAEDTKTLSIWNTVNEAWEVEVLT